MVIKLEKVPGMAVGISLMNRSSGGGVKIADVSPGSPLAPYVSKGDVLVSINGQACEQGHERAGDMLRASTGIIEIVFRAKTGSMLGSSKKSKIATAFRKGVNATIFIGADGRRRDERDGLTVPAASVGMPPKRATSPPARSASPRSSRPQTPQQTGTPTGTISAHLEADVQFRSTGASGRPKLRLPTATVLVEVDPAATAPTKDMHKELKDFKGSTTPKELKGHLLSSTTPSEADEEQLGPGEYVVVLRRNDTTSIGLRLVQKRYDDLPTVLDIDKVRTLRHSNLRGCPVPTGLPPYCRLAAAAPPPLLPAAAPRFPVLFPCYSRAKLRARVWSHVARVCCQNGPASQTKIQIGDKLLAIAGVDSRNPLEEIKRALGASKKTVVLKLRRPRTAFNPAKENSNTAVGNQGFQLTNCCGLLPRGKPDSAQEEPI